MAPPEVPLNLHFSQVSAGLIIPAHLIPPDRVYCSFFFLLQLYSLLQLTTAIDHITVKANAYKNNPVCHPMITERDIPTGKSDYGFVMELNYLAVS